MLLLLLIVVGIAIAGPVLVLDWVLIPRGMVRASYYVGWVSSWPRLTGPNAHEARGLAGIAAARAALAQRSAATSLDDRQWLEERLDVPSPQGGSTLVAQALLLLLRDQPQRALELLASVEDFPTLAPAARDIARCARAASALDDGSPKSARAILEQPGGAGRDGALLLAVARAADGQPPTAGEAQRLWLASSRPWATQPLFGFIVDEIGQRDRDQPKDRADGDADANEAAPSSREAIDGADPQQLLCNALDQHAALLWRLKQENTADVASLLRSTSQAWDAALDDPLVRQTWQQRALVLGARNPQALIDRVRGELVDELTAVLNKVPEAERPHAEDGDSLLGDLDVRAQRSSLRDFETLIAHLREAVLEARERSSDGASDQLRRARHCMTQWAQLRATYVDLDKIIEPGLRSYAFHELMGAALKLGVWLHNELRQTLWANAIFTFTLEQARKSGDSASIELLENNVRAAGVTDGA